jgi:hypothetical protein
MRDRNANARFWRDAAQSLPDRVRQRYVGYFEAAETWELLLDGALELGARVKNFVSRALHPQAA